MSKRFENVSKAVDSVNETAREIWLAGLGAVSRAQNEGSKMFDALVKDGEKFETKTRKEVKDNVVSLRKDVESRVEKVKGQATGNIQRFEKMFEDRVASVLARLGVPSADDIDALSKQVADLSKEVKQLNKAGTSKAKSTKRVSTKAAA